MRDESVAILAVCAALLMVAGIWCLVIWAAVKYINWDAILL